MKSSQKSRLEFYTFEKIFYEYYCPLVSYACKYVFRKSIAEDILQDIFIQIWLDRGKIDFETRSISPYLYRAVHNRCINYLQSIKEEPQAEDIDVLIQKEVFEMPDNSLSVKDLERELQQSIMSLPPQCKKVFIYSRHYNFKNKDIAFMLGISEKAVEKHITKALSIIREHLIDLDLLSVFMVICGKIVQ